VLTAKVYCRRNTLVVVNNVILTQREERGGIGKKGGVSGTNFVQGWLWII